MKNFTVKSTRQREKIAAIAADIKSKTERSPGGAHYVTSGVVLTGPGRVRYVVDASKKVRGWYVVMRSVGMKSVGRSNRSVAYDFSKLHLALEDQKLQITLQMVFEGDTLVSVVVTVTGHSKERSSAKNFRSTKHFDSHNK